MVIPDSTREFVLFKVKGTFLACLFRLVFDPSLSPSRNFFHFSSHALPSLPSICSTFCVLRLVSSLLATGTNSGSFKQKQNPIT